jgi:hypothetical protein
MSFKQIQNEFMQHIRDPQHHSLPDIEDRRLAIYRDLFFNNIEGFVSSAFPVLKSLYCEQDWLVRVREFFIQHDCKSPYFLQISEEFLAFLSEQYTLSENDPPYMLELAHYEWLELALSIADANANESSISLLKNDALYLSSLAWRVSYQYPVQFASAQNVDLEIQEAGNHLVVYRDDQDSIQFVAINLITAQLIQFIEATPGVHFDAVLSKMIDLMPQLKKNVLEHGLISALNELSQKGVLVTK